MVEEPPNPPIVRTKIVSPIGNAMSLVDNEQTHPATDGRQNPSTEFWVAKSLR